MSHEVIWTKIVLEEFISLANLTQEEEMIIRTRAQGWSRTKQSIELMMSVSTIDRIIKRLKTKYDKVQPYSCILPRREVTPLKRDN